MESYFAGNPPKKWKNIIFFDDQQSETPQVNGSCQEMNVKEAIAALTTALEEALREANQFSSKRTRFKSN